MNNITYNLDLKKAKNITLNFGSASIIVNPQERGISSKTVTPLVNADISNNDRQYTESFFSTVLTNLNHAVSQAKSTVVYVAKNILKIVNNWGIKFIEWNESLVSIGNIDNVKQLSHHLLKFIDHIKL